MNFKDLKDFLLLGVGILFAFWVIWQYSNEGSAESPRFRTKQEQQSSVWTGTGFFIDAKGDAVTNSHVVEGAISIKVVINGKLYSAIVLKADKQKDLAVIHVAGLAVNTSLPIESVPIVPGEPVCTVGFPMPEAVSEIPSLTCGMIQKLSSSGFTPVNVSTLPGNSGSPVIDMYGGVVGVSESIRGTESQLLFTYTNMVSQDILQDFTKEYTKGIKARLNTPENIVSPVNLYANSKSSVILIIVTKN
jgi:S1-C subfamily serine protease